MAEYIEREKATHILERYFAAPHVQMNNHYSSGMQIAIRTCIQLINDSISESPDVVKLRHGEWKYEGKTKACSLCGTFVEWNTLGAAQWRFCPYCGARMDGMTV